MPEMLGTALKGVPRDSYKLMTKFRWNRGDRRSAGEHRPLPAAAQLRVFRYPADPLRAHAGMGRGTEAAARCAQRGRRTRRSSWRTALRAMGWMPSIPSPATSGWTSRSAASITTAPAWILPSAPIPTISAMSAQVTARVKQIHKQGTGLIGMKLIGEGTVHPAGGSRCGHPLCVQCGRGGCGDDRVQEYGRDRRSDCTD